MCQHNDAKKAEIQAEIDDLNEKIEEYNDLSNDIKSGQDEVACYLSYLDTFQSQCSQISAYGSYDNGESATYINKFNDMKKELESQKTILSNAIISMQNEVRWREMTIHYMSEDCADCIAAAQASQESSSTKKGE
jgi:uncharacterized phage infection (PIP) family protein YhgE